MAVEKRKVSNNNIGFALTAAILSLIAGYSEAFDSFWMVQQWPPSVCIFKSGNCPGRNLRIFTIHGVWPQLNGRSLLNCPGTRFDITQISSLRTQLNTYWPDVLTGNNQNFWNHEWTKHGTCSESVFKQAAYFQMALRNRNRFDIIGALQSHGSGPNGQKKTTQVIKANIRQQFGKFPGLRCKTETRTNKSYLVEVVLCFQMDGATLIDCQRDTCGPDFYF